MKSWFTILALATAAMGCAMNAGEEELLDGEDIASLEQPTITPTEKAAITAKASSKSLGAYTNGYVEYSGGAQRKYEKGVVMYNRSVGAAYAMVHDQYNLWSFIGKQNFGFPIKDSYTSPSNSKVRVSRGSKGFILSTTDNVTDDAWPLMTNAYGSIYVGGDYGSRWITVSHTTTQTTINVTVTGQGFPPNASVVVGVSHINNPGRRTTVETNGNGLFSATLNNIGFYQVATWNGVATVWARTTPRAHAAVWSGTLVPSNSGYQAQNVLN